MEIKEIVEKLTGKITATGDSSRDREHLENLKVLCYLVDDLIWKIQSVAKNKDSYENSVKEIGTYANSFLDNLKEELNYYSR